MWCRTESGCNVRASIWIENGRYVYIVFARAQVIRTQKPKNNISIEQFYLRWCFGYETRRVFRIYFLLVSIWNLYTVSTERERVTRSRRIIVQQPYEREDECYAISHWNRLNKIIVFDPFFGGLFHSILMYTFSISYLRRCFPFWNVRPAHGFGKLALFQISAGEGF